ncbi:unnamed protein product [Gongylonema pulchrum]|uniref:Transthyretin-like family protein n=1 Tax=Gongylonema pulchrum TaxID=637853 RepID=A0A183D979_9BILA|nr:unnamed protein product [Gongylonema pulchrum]
MSYLRILALLGIVAFYADAGIIGSVQGVTATGRLACGTKSVRDVEIKLWEEDTESLSLPAKKITLKFSGDPDDLLNTTRSDEKGNFKIYGQDKEVTAIEPYLVIEHSCENGVINPVSVFF